MSAAALAAPGVALGAAELIALRQVALEAEAAPVLAALPGGFATRRKGRGLEVADVREYAPGDDLRHLDRGTTARTGRLHVRQFQEERDRIVLLVADFRPSMLWGIGRALRSVAAAEALALIGWPVVEHGGRVGLMALAQDGPAIVPPRGRARGMLDVVGGLVEAHRTALDRMAATAHPADPALDGALARAERLVPAGAEIVVASGFDQPGAGLADRLNRLARRRLPRLVHVTDAEGDGLPAGHYPIHLPDGRRARVRLGRGRVAGETAQIAGWPALTLSATDPVEQSARRIAEAFRSGSVPWPATA